MLEPVPKTQGEEPLDEAKSLDTGSSIRNFVICKDIGNIIYK
jgi:hypothetical protein